MKPKTKGKTDLPIGRLTKVRDFLPPPEQLAMPEDTIKVTLSLSKASVEFFKQQAVQHHTKYQRMIRALVDRYSEQFSR
jgi:hypothetical protein